MHRRPATDYLSERAPELRRRGGSPEPASALTPASASELKRGRELTSMMSMLGAGVATGTSGFELSTAGAAVAVAAVAAVAGGAAEALGGAADVYGPGSRATKRDV